MAFPSLPAAWLRPGEVEAKADPRKRVALQGSCCEGEHSQTETKRTSAGWPLGVCVGVRERGEQGRVCGQSSEQGQGAGSTRKCQDLLSVAVEVTEGKALNEA